MEEESSLPTLLYFPNGGYFVSLNCSDREKWKAKFSEAHAGIDLKEAEAVINKAHSIISDFAARSLKSIRVQKLHRRERLIEGQFVLNFVSGTPIAPIPFALLIEAASKITLNASPASG